ncbi:MAG TPA: hypothetical protein VGJ26_11630 [Pirellulales bacterium]|jgi:hypothetical protein
MAIHWQTGFSANVEAYLEIEGARFRVERVGDGSLGMRDSCRAAVGSMATLIIKVDDWEKSFQISLPEGLTSDSQQFVPFF